MTTDGFAKSQQTIQVLKALPDLSEKLYEIELSPGKSDKEKMIAVLKATKMDQPFVFKVVYRRVAGKLRSGRSISAGPVFIVNPIKRKSSEDWYWILKEPVWTLFKVDHRTLPEEDREKLKELLH